MTITNDRSASIVIGGETFELILTTRATKEIAKRYGGLENLGAMFTDSSDFAKSLDEIIYLITLLANQSVAVHNLQNPQNPRTELTAEAVELLTSPANLKTFKDAISEALVRGMERHVESDETNTTKNAPSA